MDAINRRLENVERIIPAFQSLASDLQKALPQITEMHGFYTHGRNHLATKLDVLQSKSNVVSELSPLISSKVGRTGFYSSIILVLTFLSFIAAALAIQAF